MGSEQQFCLRWNNHQSTLVAVFDTLLESGTLVDCTLAAEGQYLKAHKVVLSACSPYFELLLSQHYEKHPIVILKDVKFQELKAMMDYMYRGEVNISQDQLGALLKAAESLQIKGLSDSGGGNERETTEKRHGRKETVVPQPPPARSPPTLPLHASGLTIEHRRSARQATPPVVELPEDSPPPVSHSRISGSREGSVSPIPRKRKKHRRRSSTGEEAVQGLLPMTDSHDQTSSSCELPPQSQPTPGANIPAIISPVVPTPATMKPVSDPIATVGPDEQTEPEMTRSSLPPTQPNLSSGEVLAPDPEAIQKIEPTSELLLEPKSEYLDDTMNEDSVEDLTTLDDVDDMDQAKPGPSHGGEGSSNQGSGFAPWHVTAADRSTDEVFMAAQEAVGAHRDSQGGGSAGGSSSSSSAGGSAGGCGSNGSAKPTSSPKAPRWDPKWEAWSAAHPTVPSLLLSGLSYSTLLAGSSLGATAAVGDNSPKSFVCPRCGRGYKLKSSLRNHEKWECGKEPQFMCPYCNYRAKQKMHVARHIERMHKAKIVVP